MSHGISRRLSEQDIYPGAPACPIQPAWWPGEARTLFHQLLTQPGPKKGQSQGLTLIWYSCLGGQPLTQLVQRSPKSPCLLGFSIFCGVQNKLSSDKWQGSPQGQGMPRGSVRERGLLGKCATVLGCKFDATVTLSGGKLWMNGSIRRGHELLGQGEQVLEKRGATGQYSKPTHTLRGHTSRRVREVCWEVCEQERGQSSVFPCFGRFWDIPECSGRSHHGGSSGEK